MSGLVIEVLIEEDSKNFDQMETRCFAEVPFVEIGLLEESPRAQFKRGEDQMIRQETAALLLRGLESSHITVTTDQVAESLLLYLMENQAPEQELKIVGQLLGEVMAGQTNPAATKGELKKAIIAQVRK